LAEATISRSADPKSLFLFSFDVTMSKSKSKKPQQQSQPSQGGGIKLFGLLLILYATAAFLVNFRIVHVLFFTYSYAWLWNPLSLLTPNVVGRIWLVSAALAAVVNFFFSVIWSIAVFLFGVILVK